MQSAAVLALAYMLHVALLSGCLGETWLTKEHFSSKLPANLKPVIDATVTSKAECFFLCEKNENKCDSVGFSETLGRCKIYSHPSDQKMPLPELGPDPDGDSQMYYKQYFCPPEWIYDSQSKNCYRIWPNALQRPAAWQVCDEVFQSELVTFQTASDRDSLYKILDSNYSSMQKFWTGYTMYDNKLWLRAVPEIQGYLKRRGNCPGNDIFPNGLMVSVQDCALKCDRSYRDQCVGFVYRRSQGLCLLKTASCIGLTTDALADDYFLYDKTSPSRPLALMRNKTCAGKDILVYSDIGQWDCYQRCKNMPLSVAFSYEPAVKTCRCKFKTCFPPTTAVGSNFYEMGELAKDAGPCPFGIRYHDVCLVIIPTATNFAIAYNNCRLMGGHLAKPTEHSMKTRALYAMMRNRGIGVIFFDWIEVNTNDNWGTWLDRENLAAPIYSRLPYRAGQPDSNTYLGCGNSMDDCNNPSFEHLCLGDEPCTSNYAYICEVPAAKQFPTTCRFTPPGADYMGTLSRTASGASCRSWSSDSNWAQLYRQFPDWHSSHAYCRNPDLTWNSSSVWCIRNSDGQREVCDVPLCPEVDWAAGQSYQNLLRPHAVISKTTAADDGYDWTVEDVASTANPICMMPADNWCPLYFRGSCYKIYNVLKNGTEARQICSNNGWHLASITSEAEDDFLQGQLFLLQRILYINRDGYWIGLSGNSTAGFMWHTGEPMTYSNWQAATTSAPCALMAQPWTDGGWKSDSCSGLAYFVCEFEFG